MIFLWIYCLLGKLGYKVTNYNININNKRVVKHSQHSAAEATKQRLFLVRRV